MGKGWWVAEAAVRGEQLGLGRLNPTAVYKRLRSAEEWVRWLAEQMRSDLGMVSPSVGRRVRAVDATSISEQGSTGTDWRIHYAINLKNLQCDFFLLTDVRGGETWRRFPVSPGGIMLGDRGYATPKGVQHVVEAKGDVVVRLNRGALPLFDEKGKRLAILKRVRQLKPRQSAEWPPCVHSDPHHTIPVQLTPLRPSQLPTETPLHT